MVLCARLLIAVVCAVLTAASVVEGIAYASAVLKRVYLHDDWNLMMWVAFLRSFPQDSWSPHALMEVCNQNFVMSSNVREAPGRQPSLTYPQTAKEQ